MSFDLIGLGSVADDGTGSPARTGGERINAVISAANNGQFQGLKNRIINGDFGIWQRGVSFPTLAGSGGVTRHADMWQSIMFSTLAGTAVTRQTFTPGQTDVPGARHFLRFDHTANPGYGSTQYALIQPIEDVARFGGIPHVFSFYARASASFSLRPTWVQSFGTGGSSNAAASLSLQALSTDWTRYQWAFTPASIFGKTIGDNNYMAMYIEFMDTFTAQVEFADIQLEPGTVATPFERLPPALQLANCQRSYVSKTVRSENGSRHIPLPAMRAAPSVTVGVGSAANITSHGFELTHTSAADCTVAASAEQ